MGNMVYNFDDLPDLDDGKEEQKEISHNFGQMEPPKLAEIGVDVGKVTKNDDEKDLGFSYNMVYDFNDLPELDDGKKEEKQISHNFGQMELPKLSEMKNEKKQLVRVYHLPVVFDTDELFRWLGKTYTIHRRSRKILILEVDSKEAETLVKEKNSKIFGGHFVGLRFEDGERPSYKKKKPRKSDVNNEERAIKNKKQDKKKKMGDVKKKKKKKKKKKRGGEKKKKKKKKK